MPSSRELVRAAGCDDLEGQAYAAYGLTRGHRSGRDHRDLLVRFVAQWPVENESYYVGRVREHVGGER